MGVPSAAPSFDRFSGRADFYATGRPHYPAAVIGWLREREGFSRNSEVVDIGSGTGLSSELFLPYCKCVYGVEPNHAMRALAERRLEAYANFRSVCGSAESTGLPTQDFDLVVCGSALHWFAVGPARAEFVRILRPGGKVVVMTNRRRADASPFMRSFDRIYRTYAQPRVRPEWDEMLRGLFQHSRYETGSFENSEVLDFSRLRERLLSYSVIPLPDSAGHERMVEDLRGIFDATQTGGTVAFHLETRISAGTL